MSDLLSNDPDVVRDTHWREIDAISKMVADLIGAIPSSGPYRMHSDDQRTLASNLIGHAVRGEPYHHLIPRFR